jgi:hypothetical protein
MIKRIKHVHCIDNAHVLFYYGYASSERSVLYVYCKRNDPNG